MHSDSWAPPHGANYFILRHARKPRVTRETSSRSDEIRDLRLKVAFELSVI